MVAKVPIQELIEDEQAPLSDRQGRLAPLRHPQRELFLCDIADAVLKDELASMEHPFYSLSKKPDTKIRRYEHGDKWLEVVPSAKGRPTIYDKDLMIYVYSQLCSAKKAGRTVSKRVRIVARDFLIFTNRRGDGGRDYELLKDLLTRIRGTTFITNIEMDDQTEEIKQFGLFDEASIIRSKTGRIIALEIVVSDWMMRNIDNNRVLTLHKDYFRLDKPIERRLYELGRKHCGYQTSWEASMELLHKKSGAVGTLKDFRFNVKKVVASNHLPDYSINYESESDKVIFWSREGLRNLITGGDFPYTLDVNWRDIVREEAPGWCPDLVLGQFKQNWATKGKERLRDVNAAFRGFCVNFYARRGRP